MAKESFFILFYFIVFFIFLFFLEQGGALLSHDGP